MSIPDIDIPNISIPHIPVQVIEPVKIWRLCSSPVLFSTTSLLTLQIGNPTHRDASRNSNLVNENPRGTFRK